MVEYAFAERRLHKVVARALVTNEASPRVFERLGFREEGIQRDQKYVDGEYVDVVRYSLLRREWEGR
jgi:RimJ/RimL family protein N-acetyltransferase